MINPCFVSENREGSLRFVFRFEIGLQFGYGEKNKGRNWAVLSLSNPDEKTRGSRIYLNLP